MSTAAGADEALVLARRDAILAATGKSEAVPTLSVFAALVTVYTVLHIAVGHAPGTHYVAVDLFQVTTFLVTALLLQRDLISDCWVPTAVMVAVVIGVSGQTYDYTIDGERWAILIAVTLSGSVVLHWRPFLLGSILTWAIPSAAFVQYDRTHPESWVLGTLVAVAVAANLVRSRRQTALRLARAEVSIEQLATIDPMTGLLNRRGLTNQAHLIRGAARRTQQPVFAVFIDIGGLKTINDTYGHATGDALIVSTAAAVARIARETDLACRWGGDEFLIIGVGLRPNPSEVNRRLLTVLDSSRLPSDWTPVLWTGSAQSVDAQEHLDSVILRADEDLYVNRSRSGDRAA